VVPVGRNAAGVPVGVQVVAPYLHDRRAVRAARLIGDVAGGYESPPGFGPLSP
jgi:amidase